MIDSETRSLLGRCYASGAVRPAPATGQIYYLAANAIAVCDLNTFQVLGTITLPTTLSFTGPYARLVRCCAGGVMAWRSTTATASTSSAAP